MSSMFQEVITLAILFLFVLATWAAFAKQSIGEVLIRLKELLFGDEDE